MNIVKYPPDLILLSRCMKQYDLIQNAGYSKQTFIAPVYFCACVFIFLQFISMDWTGLFTVLPNGHLHDDLFLGISLSCKSNSKINWFTVIALINLSRVMGKPTFWFLTWSDTNQAVQLLKMARGLKFQI